MFTTHTKTLTELEMGIRSGAVDIRHPSGLQQTHSVDDVLRFRDDKIVDLVMGHKDLDIFDRWLADMGSPIPATPLKGRYLSIHQKWIVAGGPESWLLQKGVLTKIIGLVEPKGT